MPDDDALLLRLRADIRRDDTVVDVGAGAGRYALPLAQLARQVIVVLVSLGVVADVLIAASGSFRYADLDEAVAETRERMRLPHGHSTDERLRSLLAEHLVRDEGGHWRWPNSIAGHAILSWRRG